jgi:hypothetical protein
MTQNTHPLVDFDDDAAEATALAAAIAEARADPRGVDHADMRELLLKIAAGDFNAQAPELRLL